MNDPRLQLMKGIEAALTSNVGGVQNAHPWIKPMWLEIQRLRKELGELKPEQPIKPASELLKEKQDAAKAPEKKAPRRAKKTDTDEG